MANIVKGKSECHVCHRKIEKKPCILIARVRAQSWDYSYRDQRNILYTNIPNTPRELYCKECAEKVGLWKDN